jgi:hypothetical protein
VRRVFLMAAVIFLAGCGGQEAGQGEETTVEKTVVRTVEVTSEYTAPSPEEQREADAAKAAAAEEEITLEILNELDTSKDYDTAIMMGLLNCQLQKYAADHGEAAAEEFALRSMEEAVDAPEGEEIVSLQEEFIGMGYSCTIPEALEHY